MTAIKLVLSVPHANVIILATVPCTLFCDHLSKKFHFVQKLCNAIQIPVSTCSKVYHTAANDSTKPEALTLCSLEIHLHQDSLTMALGWVHQHSLSVETDAHLYQLPAMLCVLTEIYKGEFYKKKNKHQI